MSESAVKLVYTSKEARCGICGVSRKTNVKVWTTSPLPFYPLLSMPTFCFPPPPRAGRGTRMPLCPRVHLRLASPESRSKDSFHGTALVRLARPFEGVPGSSKVGLLPVLPPTASHVKHEIRMKFGGGDEWVFSFFKCKTYVVCLRSFTLYKKNCI